MVSYAFLFAIALSVLLITCKKEPQDLPPPTTATNNTIEDVQFIYGDFDPANSLLQDFHDEIENEEVSDREVSEALWTLETYLGYQLNNFTKVFESFESYDLMLDLEESSTEPGSIAGEEILAAYNEVIDYANVDLDSLSIFMLDISFDSENGGVYHFKLDVIAGINTGNERPEGITHLTSGTYPPYGNACTKNLGIAINEVVNQGLYYSTPTGYPFVAYECGGGGARSLSNVNIYYLLSSTSCCGGGGNTYNNQHHIYDATFNSCLAVGGSTDNGLDNTANGWLNEAKWIIDDENSSLSGGNKVQGFFLSSYYWKESIYIPPFGWHYYDHYVHKATITTGKIYCLGPFS